jgi:hypothetical protein
MSRPNKNVVGAGRSESSISATAKRIKVRAVRTGYYDHARRRAGDVFTIDEKDFSDANREPTKEKPHLQPGWMVKVPARTPESITTGQEELNQTYDAARAQRAGQNVDDGEL